MEKIVVLIVVLVTVTLCNASIPCTIGGSCEQDGLPGIYTLDKDCPHFLRLAPKKRYGHGWCNFSDKNAVICCIGAHKAAPEIHPPVIFNRMSQDCEYFGRNNFTLAVDRIFGGMDSFPGEFPHFAALGYVRNGKNVSFDCGGTLITDRHVLTAAHCTMKSNSPSIVRLGSVNELSTFNFHYQNFLHTAELFRLKTSSLK